MEAQTPQVIVFVTRPNPILPSFPTHPRIVFVELLESLPAEAVIPC